MPIAMLSSHPNLTLAHVDEVDRRIHEATGGGNANGLIRHWVSGTDAGLTVYEIWESEADLAAFGQLLGPIITEMGLGSGQPVVVPLHTPGPGSPVRPQPPRLGLRKE